MRHDSSTRHWIRLPGRVRGRPLPFTAAAAAVVLATGITAVAVTRTVPANAAASSRTAAQDQPVQARVNKLLNQMTLPEKIGQMVQIEVTQVTDTSNTCTSQGGFNLPNPVCEQKIFVDNNVGSILAGGTDIPVDTTSSGGTGTRRTAFFGPPLGALASCTSPSSVHSRPAAERMSLNSISPHPVAGRWHSLRRRDTASDGRSIP